MAEDVNLPPGTFIWMDLMTNDLDGAKAFYGGLFGWEAGNAPVHGDSTSEWRLDGDLVAGLTATPPERQAAGSRPGWFQAINVIDVDATKRHARELGGTDNGEPVDVAGFGRVAIITDPVGATFGAWQPDPAFVYPRFNAPGFLIWNELQTVDLPTAIAFYTALFGWETEPMEESAEKSLHLIKNAGRPNGGMLSLTEWQQGNRSEWLPYFAVDSCDAAIVKVRDLGGEVVFGPVDIPVGRFTVVLDPQGAEFYVFQTTT